MLSDAQRKRRKQELHEKIAGHTPYAVLRNNIDPPWIGLTLRKLAATPPANQRPGANRDHFFEKPLYGLGAGSLARPQPAGHGRCEPPGRQALYRPHRRKGRRSYGDEELTFYDGKLYSVDCARWGFGEGIVTTRTADDGIHFEAETRSENTARSSGGRRPGGPDRSRLYLAQTGLVRGNRPGILVQGDTTALIIGASPSLV